MQLCELLDRLAFSAFCLVCQLWTLFHEGWAATSSTSVSAVFWNPSHLFDWIISHIYCFADLCSSQVVLYSNSVLSGLLAFLLTVWPNKQNSYNIHRQLLFLCSDRGFVSVFQLCSLFPKFKILFIIIKSVLQFKSSRVIIRVLCFPQTCTIFKMCWYCPVLLNRLCILRKLKHRMNRKHGFNSMMANIMDACWLKRRRYCLHYLHYNT